MNNETTNNQLPNKASRKRITLDVQTIIIALLVMVIAVMTGLWQPWDGLRGRSDRTIEVTGSTTVKAEPDQYIFMPTYNFKNTDRKAANDAASKKSTELVAALKKLAVQDKDIKTNINGYDSSIPDAAGNSSNTTDYTASLMLTVTTSTRDEAQKIQDYLAETGPEGQITPQATFSEAKRKQLESSARDEATKNARTKADQSAKNLGFKIGSVKQVNDGVGFGAMPMLASGIAYATGEVKDTAVASSPALQPGENELSYSVTVTYFLR